MKLMFRGVVVFGGDTKWIWLPHFHYLKGIHAGVCLFNFKFFLSVSDPVDMIPTMFKIQVIHNRIPIQTDN